MRLRRPKAGTTRSRISEDGQGRADEQRLPHRTRQPASLKRPRGIRTAAKISLHHAGLRVRLPLGAVVFFVVMVQRADASKIVLGLSWRRLEVRFALIELSDLPVLDFLTRLYSRRSGVVVPGHAGLLVLGE
jgi:hypothetical protein